MPRRMSSSSEPDAKLAATATASQQVGPLFWEALPSGALVHDLPAWRAYTGQPAPLPSSGWMDGVVHPADRSATTLAWAQALQTGAAVSITHRLRAADGSYRTFLTQAAPVLDEHGAVARFQGVSCDLSAREHEEAITAQHAETFALTSDAIILTDREGCITDWNPAAERLFGYTREEVLGKTTGFLHEEPDPQRIPRQVLATLASEGIFRGVNEYTRKDGRVITFETTVLPALDAQGQMIGTIGVNRDITARTMSEAEVERVLEGERATRRELETALASAQAAEAQFHTLIDRNIIGVFIADADYIIEANDAFLRTFGYERADVEARAIRWVALTPPGWTEADDRASQELITQGACTPYEKEYLRKDGTPVPILLGGVLLEWQPLRIMGFVIDITDRKRLEHEVAARAAELVAVFDAMPEGVVLFGADGAIRHMNPHGRALFSDVETPDYVTLALPERTLRVVMRDELGQPLAKEQWPVARVLSGETITSDKPTYIQYVNEQGETAHVSVTGAPLRDESDGVSGAVVVYQDVSEQRALARRTHQALDALLRLAGELVQAPGEDASDVARRLGDLTCRVLGCERVAISVLSPTENVYVPLTVAGLRPEQEAQWWEEQRATRVSPADMERNSPELTARLRAGEPIVFDLTKPPYDTQPNPYGVQTLVVAPLLVSGELIGTLAVDHGERYHQYTEDEVRLAGAVAQLVALVVERERLLEDRARAQAQVLALETANARMDTFLGVASHELRTPLTSIKANIQIIDFALQRFFASNPETEARLARAAELVHRTDRHVERLDRLVEDLLDVSRIQAGTLALERERSDLAAIVREAVEEQRLARPNRRITLEGTEEPVWVDADADRVGQVVTNYLTNALKYSEEDAPVAVTLAVEERQAIVRVRDEGPGLPRQERERVWERFHRVPGIEVLSGSGVGLGLGLFISKTIVERHGGQVGVESEPGEGSTFWLALPVEG